MGPTPFAFITQRNGDVVRGAGIESINDHSFRVSPTDIHLELTPAAVAHSDTPKGLKFPL